MANACQQLPLADRCLGIFIWQVFNAYRQPLSMYLDLQALRASSPVLQHLLLPPLAGTGSRSGSEPPSPYLDVSTAMSAFTSSSSPTLQHPHSPLGQQQQQRRCYSPGQSPSPSSQLRTSSGCSSPAWCRLSEAEAAAEGRPAAAAAAGASGNMVSSTSWQRQSQTLPASAGAAGRQLRGHTAPAIRSAAAARSSTSSKQQQQQQRCRSAAAASISCVDAGLRRARRGRRGWDGNTNPPLEPIFGDALRAWQEDTEAGVYGEPCVLQV
jgi:hypothetical protein